jgi:hypothetical protein
LRCCRPFSGFCPKAFTGTPFRTQAYAPAGSGRFDLLAVSSLPAFVPVPEHPSMSVGLPFRSAVLAGSSVRFRGPCPFGSVPLQPRCCLASSSCSPFGRAL